jgi:glycosyltransferase involved in cell wall biosynthesis
MPLLVNPFNRIVAIDDMDQYAECLAKEGFRKPTDKEEADYLKERMMLKQRLDAEADALEEDSVYMATVSLGGKDGYGMAAQKLFNELQDLGIKVSTSQNNQKIGFLFHSPQSLIRLENPFRVVYTMFESDKIPDEWKEYLDAADLVLVPSKWCQEVFAKAGVRTEVVPLGYDDKIFTYRNRPIKRDTREDFIFLHYNAFNLRKGFLEVFKAFAKAFDPSEPVKLYLKTTVTNPYERFPFISPQKDPKVIVDNTLMTEAQLADLCGSADAFLFPSRGEGFGMTPLEAMATGLPTIVPNAHGISEYFNSDYMYEVKIKEMGPAIYSRYKGMDVGGMPISDVDHLASQMRYIYEHQEEAAEKGRLAAEYVTQWTYRNTALRLKEIFDHYLSKEVSTKAFNTILPLEEVK